MLNTLRTPLVAAGLVGFALVGATIAVAEENSSSPTPANASAPTAGQPSAINQSNLSPPDSAQTEQQNKAPVVDPQAAATEHSVTAPASPGQTERRPGANIQEWPAPQRYESGRGTGINGASRPGGATLGVNVVGSDDGQGVIVAQIRPGTPAHQMGLQPRDRILSLNGQPVGSVDEFIAAIRGMAGGDEVQLSIDRGGNTRDIGGRLQAFRESVAVGEGPVGNIIGHAREIIGRERPAGENLQTSYEEGTQSNVRNSGDVEARIARLEQQIERLTQEIHQLRNNGSSSQADGANAQPSTNTPSALDATPEQPPRLQSPTK